MFVDVSCLHSGVYINRRWHSYKYMFIEKTKTKQKKKKLALVLLVAFVN